MHVITDAVELAVERLVDDIAHRIRSLRHKQHLRQTELADRCKLRQQTISKLENSDYRRNEFIVSVWKVANFFKIEPSVFLFGHSTLTSEAIDIARKWDRSSDKNKKIVSAMLED